MTKVKVVNWKKEVVADMDLPSEFFEKKPNMSLLHDVIRWQRACRRQGTHKAKTRAEVSGGGKKPFRQKGTGNARQGSSRSPLNVAGGVTFGPRPRDYSYSLPAKIRKAGLKQALSYLWREKKVVVVEDMKSPNGKTKELFERLQVFGWKKALLVDQDLDVFFQRACGNLKFFQFLPVKALNPYDVLKYGHLIMSQKSLLQIQSAEEVAK